MGLAKIMSPDSPITTSNRLTQLEKRMGQIEQRVLALETRQPITLGDQSQHRWGNVGDNAYYHRGDVSGTLAQVAPWVSTTTRCSERLTSIEFVKATAGQAICLGTMFTGLGSLAAYFFDLSWTIAPVCGITGATLSLGVLIMLNRSELHSLVSAQADKNVKRQQEVKIQIDKTEGERVAGIEFLYVAGVTLEQLIEFAPTALRTESLVVNAIGGGGRLFTQGQAQALGSELELLGYATAARGPQGRRLTAKGRALFRGLAEMGV